MAIEIRVGGQNRDNIYLLKVVFNKKLLQLFHSLFLGSQSDDMKVKEVNNIKGLS